MKKITTLIGVLFVSLSAISSAQGAVIWDDNFGVDGKSIVEGGPSLGGRIVTTADGGAFIGSSGFARVARVSVTGKLVSSYGDSGVARIPNSRFPRGILDVTSMDADHAGRIVVAGVLTYVRTGGQVQSTFVARFTRKGKPDNSLGGDGVILRPKKRGFSNPDLLPLPDRGFLVSETQSGRANIARFRENGRPDRRFGKRGSVSIAKSDSWGIDRLPSGKLILAVEKPRELRLVRLRRDGELDRSFGHGSGSVALATITPNSVSDVQLGVTKNRVRAFVQWRRDGQRSFGVLSRKLDGTGKAHVVLTAKRLRTSIDVGADFRISPYVATAAFQRDGGILVGAYSPKRPLIFRISGSGRVDRDFAQGGVFASEEVSDRLEPAAYPNGGILAAGQSGNESLSLFKFRSR